MGKKFQFTCELVALALLAGCSDGGASQGMPGPAPATGGTSNGSFAGSGNASAGASGRAGAVAGAPASVSDCQMFPPEDAWNVDVSALPADQGWTELVQELVGDARIHPDFGVDGSDLYGIPINVVPEDQPGVAVAFDWFEDESDPGPYPFPGPDQVIIEGNDPRHCDGDCHLLVIQRGACLLYEGYACEYREDGWHCGNGAKWDLKRVGYGQRAEGWTSADAAGLAIAPGLLRYAEVRAGEVTHALRFTLACSADKYVSPASHYAVPGGCDPQKGPPMGTRVRLRADFDISSFSRSAQTVLRGMKKYGLILADNGSNFYFQGEANSGWTEDDIEPLKQVPASAFEVVSMPPLKP